MQRDDNAPGWSGVASGWTVPTGLRSAVVRVAKACRITVDAWLHHAVVDRLELEQVAAMLGCSASELQARALRVYLRTLGVPRGSMSLGVDNGDEYGQRVVTHAAMVRGMERP